jgi:long-chain acyl-CoA synthetase
MKNKPYDLYQLPVFRDLKELLFQKIKSQPEGIAFAFSKGRNQITEKTYREFWEEVNALGTWMNHQEIQGHIAIIGENSYEWLLCFFAIVNGGNVAVPIDKELPEEEIAALLEKADVQTVFYSQSYYGNIKSYAIGDMDTYLAAGKRMIASGSRGFLDYQIDHKKMCCVMFTSGTSGVSKGVMLSHENFAEDINGSCQLFVLEGNTLPVLPFHHAFGLVVGVFMVFHYGYTIYINRSLKTIQKDLQIAKPQTMFLVPLFVETFHKQIWSAAKKEGREKQLHKMMKLSDWLLKRGIDIRGKIFTSVRQAFGGNLAYIICGGAPLGVSYIQEFRSWGIEILNGYGTTECSPCAAVNRNFFHKDGTVGMAVPNIKVRISDEGEVLIQGPIVMLGYYKDEAATKEAFRVQNERASAPEQGMELDNWYATGDLGIMDEDGFITLTGRKKNLIILSNGENVSPEELEADFYKDEAVREVLVYEKDGLITAEIFPNEDYLKSWGGMNAARNEQEYFEKLRMRINRNRPMYKQIGEVLLRDSEFPKNTSKKIIRYEREK